MKKLLTRIRNATVNHTVLNLDKDIWYILEHDVETDQTGVVVTYRSPEVGVQGGLTRTEFLELYPDFENVLPADPHVISFLEFASVEDFERGELEKAYVIYTAHSAFEGITGYPISTKGIEKDVQIAVPVTDANLSKIPSEVLSVMPQTSGLSYIRYNEDFSRISYEKEYAIYPEDTLPEIDGIENATLAQYVADVRDYLGVEKVQLMVKHTIGKPAPKIYFALSSCSDCQD